MNQDFKKVVHVGKVLNYSGKRRINVFCKIEFVDGRLSISGVEGPLPSGNAQGGCGQIVMSPHKWDSFAPGWSYKTWIAFKHIWEKWHLNDMRAGCEHQKGGIWEYHDITITKYSIEHNHFSVLKKQVNLATDSRFNLDCVPGLQAAREYSGAAQILLDLFGMNIRPFSKTPIREDMWKVYLRESPELQKFLEDAPNALQIETEKKGNGWTYEVEHAEGILMRPCPVCGYKYGSAWNFEEVPQDVLEFLMALPDTDITPAWV